MKAHTSLKLATSMLVAGLMAFATPVFADLVTGSFTGTCTGGGTCAGSFSITTGAGFVDITLTNDVTDPHSAGAMLSDINFTLSSGANITPAITATGSGNKVRFTDGSGAGTSLGAGTGDWALSGTGGVYHLTALNGGQPDNMISGPTTAGYCTPTCQGSIPNFNDYFQDSADFHLLISGVTAETDISNVSLSFGTAGETVLVPIPAALWLFASGLLGLIGIARRRMGVTSSPAAA